MANAIGSILRKAQNKTGKLNILCMPAHERYETQLAKTGHNFYALDAPNFKRWNPKYAVVPKNYHLLDCSRGLVLPPDIEFDLALCHNKGANYNVLKTVARQLHIPLVNLEHCLPQVADPEYLKQYRVFDADLSLFISEYSRGEWGFGENEASVVHHGIDTELFKPDQSAKQPVLLSVVNAWKDRDWACGYTLWTKVVQGLPVKVAGDNPGLSAPARNVKELVSFINSSRVFLNTSLVSPVPTSLLEAMSCGAACVSTATCMIPEIIQHGVNGFISNDEKELRKYCQLLLKDENLANQLGAKARQTILERFSQEKFVNKWNGYFDSLRNFVYKGI